MNSKIEVLSPAGSWDSLKAAAAAGADAVYFSGSSFNARRNAENFKDEDIKNVVSYCHARGIKAYFALNTIVFDYEIKEALKLASNVCASGIDALILQDVGLASLIHRAAPEVKLHASTQMSVHNISGINQLAEMGFSRVVLARELSSHEIARIAKSSPIELEVFVHGAHCMSVSGQCYMSAFFGGSRSGNRGLCAQPCRLPFSVGSAKNVLSLKDLSIINNIPELAELGVVSAKIEGRMKSPEYVYAATSCCRKAADGEKISGEDLDRLKVAFSRSGFTSGYFDSKIDKDMFGVRQYEDYKMAIPQLKRFCKLFEGVERQKIMVDFYLNIDKSSVSLKARDCDMNTAEVKGSPPEKAQKHEIEWKTARDKLLKTGGTPFKAADIKISIEPGLSVPVSEINKLRREVLCQIYEKRSAIRPIPFDESVIETFNSGFSTKKRKDVKKLRLRFRSIEQIPNDLDLDGIDMIIMPIFGTLTDKAAELIKKGVRIAAEIPRTIFSDEKHTAEKLSLARELGVNDAVCGNLGAVYLAKQLGFNVHGDFGLNISNNAAINTFSEIGVSSSVLSFETPIKSIIDISKRAQIPWGLIIYGRLPLMLVRNCPVRSFRGCLKGKCSIKDRTKTEFPLVCDNGVSEILNSRPLWLLDKKSEFDKIGMDFFELYFTIENRNQVKNIIESCKKGLAPDGEFTRGLYFHKGI